MFRKMRRFKQQLTSDECIKILENHKSGVLAVNGDNGYPYTVPLNFVYANGKIYFHCAKSGHKLDAIKANDKVSFCVIDKDDTDAEKLTDLFRSVVVFGRAKILENDKEIKSAMTTFGLKFNDNINAVEKEINLERSVLCCVKIEIEHLSGKQAIELVGNNRELK